MVYVISADPLTSVDLQTCALELSTQHWEKLALQQGFSNCGTRKVVRLYAIKFIKIVNLI